MIPAAAAEAAEMVGAGVVAEAWLDWEGVEVSLEGTVDVVADAVGAIALGASGSFVITGPRVFSSCRAATYLGYC